MSDSSDNTPDLSDKVAIAALVISTIALLGVVLQYLQIIQGRPSFDEKVLDQWARYAGWTLKLTTFKLKYELEYEAPVIFLAQSDNPRWPVANAPCWVLDGTRESCLAARVDEPPEDPEDVVDGLPDREPVHTTKNELASWIRVITAAQKMERDSKRWENARWASVRNLVSRPVLPPVTTLAVTMQPMKRTYDHSTRKPYATTTIGHLVELCAVLGLYWREFNQDTDKYRAEGNGYTLLGDRVPDLGIVFAFEKPGWPRFRKNRVIPTSEVKELCFGNVPTFWRLPSEDANWDSHWSVALQEQGAMGIHTLQLGSHREIGETLNLIGCNEYTIQCYADESESARKHVHLFPVIFEVLGMLARTLHLTDRPFTYLPNPVIYPLNKHAFSLRRLLSEFTDHLNEEIKHANYNLSNDLTMIQAQARELDASLPQTHFSASNQLGEYSPLMLNKLHTAISHVDEIWRHTSKDIVLDVLRRHVQEVLLAINTPQPGSDASVASSAPTSPLSTRVPNQTVNFADVIVIEERISLDSLLEVPLEHRERELMERYFTEVRLRVVVTSEAHHDRRATEASLNIHSQGSDDPSQHPRQQDIMRVLLEDAASQEPLPMAGEPGQGSLQRRERTPLPSQIPASSRVQTFTTQTSRQSSATEGLQRPSRHQTWRSQQPSSTDVQRNTVWCALVFRMLCWLILHDFDKKDVQIPKSELMGSRLCVFIV